MGETRVAKFARHFAGWIDYTISSFPENQRETYRQSFIKELKTYSVESRKQGAPRNSGCVFELEGIVNANISDPVYLARLVKENLHIMYQKPRTATILKLLLETLDSEQPQPSKIKDF